MHGFTTSQFASLLSRWVFFVLCLILSGCGDSSHVTIIEEEELVSIQILPLSRSHSGVNTLELVEGNEQQLQAIGVFKSNITANITDVVAWSSSNQTSMTVDSTGNVKAVSASGQSQITAVYQGITSNALTFVAKAPELLSIQVTPKTVAMVVGATQQLSATGLYSDNTTANLTDQVSWQVSNATAASVTSEGVLQALLADPSVAISASFLGINSNSVSVEITSAPLVAIFVEPSTFSLAQGLTQTLTAQAIYSDQTTRDVTDEVSWSHSTSAVSITDDGVVSVDTANSSAVITATLDGITSNNVEASTTNAQLEQIQVTPATLSIVRGNTAQLTATGIYSDGTKQTVTDQVFWISNNTNEVVAAQNGVIFGANTTATTSSDVTVQAVLGAVKSNTVAVTVAPAEISSIQITPAQDTLVKGLNVQFTATATLTDGSQHDVTSLVAWKSSNTNVVTVTSSGLALAADEGNSTITATLNNIVSNSAQLVVTKPTLTQIQISPSTLTIPKGYTGQFTAIGVYSDSSTVDLSNVVVWNSNDTAVATVNSAGLASSITTGDAVITAAYDGIQSANALLVVSAAQLETIQVTPPSDTLPVGTSQQFEAMGHFSDKTVYNLTSLVTWQSSDPQSLTIESGDGGGVATAVATNTNVTVTASLVGITSNDVAIVVSDAKLTELVILPATLQMPKGLTQQYTALGTYSDKSQRNVTTDVLWKTSDNAIATINAAGVLTAVSVGDTQVSATLDGVSSQISNVRINDAVLQSIQVTPSVLNLAKGESASLTAVGVFSDKSTRDITNEVGWTNSSVGAISVNSEGEVTGLAVIGDATLAAVYSGIASNTVTVSVTAATLSMIQVTPSGISLTKGSRQQFTATAFYSDNSRSDVTDKVSWSSSATTDFTINDQGLGYAIAENPEVEITALLDGVTSSDADVTITSATLTSVQVTPTQATLVQGLQTQLTAIANFSDGTSQDVTDQIDWQSSNDTSVTVSSTGDVRALLAPSSASISGTWNGVTSNSSTITVIASTLSKLVISTQNNIFPQGTTVNLSAVAIFSDGTTEDVTNQVSWVSSDTASVTITGNGVAFGVAVSSAVQVTASLNGTVSNSIRLDVAPANLVSLQVIPNESIVAKGVSGQFEAIGRFSNDTTRNVTDSVNWTSADPSLVSITKEGQATALAATGSDGVVITATFSLTSSTAKVIVTDASLQSIQITPATVSLAKGYTQQFTAVGNYSDGTTADITDQVVWQSLDTADVTMSKSGLAYAAGVGSDVTVEAVLGTVTSNSAKVTVTDAALVALQITPTQVSIAQGITSQLTATGQFSDQTSKDLTSEVNWISSNTANVTVSSAGVIQGLLASSGTQVNANLLGITSNTATITVTAATLQSIDVTPNSISIPKGNSGQFTATGNYSDNTRFDLTDRVSWLTNASTNITLNGSGVATGIAVSTGNQVFSKLDGVTSNTVTVDVTDRELVSIQITPATVSLAAGTTQQLQATGIYTDNSTLNLTDVVSWLSSDTSIATVSGTGNVTAVAVGDNVTVTASYEGKVSNSSTITVTNAVLSSIQITPATLSIAKGYTQQYTAIGHYSNGDSVNITDTVTWESLSTEDVTINATGLAYANNVSSDTKIEAFLDGVTSNTALMTVTDAVLVELQITPAQLSIAKGITQQLTATGRFSDQTTQNLTDTVNWISSNTTDVSVSATGLVQGVTTSEGTTITANDSGITSNSVSVAVTAAILQSIDVTPSLQSIPKGSMGSFSAIGQYSDNSRFDITDQVDWLTGSSTNISLTSEGVVTGLVVSSDNSLFAKLGNVTSNTAEVDVIDRQLVSIQVTPASISVALGSSQQLTAIGLYTDNTTVNLTDVVSWSSSNTANVTVSAEGLTTAVAVSDKTLVNATYQGILSNDATITVTDATVIEVQIEPSSVSIAKGLSTNLTAIAIYSDNSAQNVTDSVSWWTGDSSNVIVNPMGKITGLEVSTGNTIDAYLNGIRSNVVDVSVVAAVPESIQITPAVLSIAKGQTQAMTATMVFSDKSTQDVTSLVTWQSANTTDVSVSLSGVVTGEAVASNVAVTATYEGLTSNQAQVTVTDVTLTSIQITPAIIGIADGQTVTMTAVGIYSDNSSADITTQVAWSGSDNNSFTINSSGLLQAVSPSTNQTVRAYLDGVSSNEATVTITDATLDTINISPVEASVPEGRQLQFRALGQFSNGTEKVITDEVTWYSAQPSELSIAQSGLATALAVGTDITVYAVKGTLTSPNSSITVTDAVLESISVTPDTLTLPKGVSAQLQASGTYSNGTSQPLTDVSWVSSDTTQLTVSSSGEVTALEPTAKVTVTATKGSITSDPVDIEITDAALTSVIIRPTSDTLNINATVQFEATGEYTDNSTAELQEGVTWQSSNTSVLTVSSAGLARGIKQGTVNVTGSYEGKTSAPSEVTVANLGKRSIPLCGGFNNASKTNAATACLKVISTAFGDWFTSSPSLAALERLGFTENPGSAGLEKTYTGTRQQTVAPVGTFGLFDQLSGSSASGQAAQWCDYLASIGFAGESNWELPSEFDLRLLYLQYGNLMSGYGWPGAVNYWTSSTSGGQPELFNLTNGDDTTGTNSSEAFVSCISPLF
ncbi:hypothetical protein HGP28_10375 [Vibrio sp. SM6]|uniref:BIG2 domain-containing protein n=1 Tax=Vibrio agarilyticus TaxID=2726741 RepID=A0A7X8TR46_9VIBR|nr:Ig-like domain-containing protein [Vibrio agarilyticus]NLS13296.1 hypothetical protein [Vibrio agarilyticus]